MRRAFIYIGQDYAKDVAALLDVVRQLHQDEAYEVYGLVINGEPAPYLELFDTIFLLQDERLRSYDQLALCDVVSYLHKMYEFDSIIMLGTQSGRMLAPRIAMEVNAGLVADVTAIEHFKGKLRLIRPAYSGRMMAAIEVSRKGPVMLTVRPGVFSFQGKDKKNTRILELEKISCRMGKVRQIRKEQKPLTYDICECDVLVSGGGGVVRGFEALEPLAGALGGHVSASRAVVDKGLISRSAQVGQSGKTVRPSLYMAFGIHGAIQHVVALEHVNYIISVNTNANAPICSLSDIVVEGDAVSFANELLKKIREEQADGTY